MRDAWNDLPLPALYARLASSGLVDRLLRIARDEDLGARPVDLTTAAMGIEGDATARLAAREPMAVAGLACMPELLAVFAPNAAWSPACADGERVQADTSLGELAGPAPELLALERTMLNLVGRLAGIATNTARYVEAVAGAKSRVLDTRKTTPGLRLLEKYAVRCGGGFCHRMGLHDAVLIKDNHLAGLTPEQIAERVGAAAARARASADPMFVEVEVDSLEQLEGALRASGVNIVLLDNMDADTMRRAVAMRDGLAPSVLLEASGGVRLETIRAIAEAGVDRISAGALTHQATSVDVGLDFQ
ncbi:MAG: carboxylating nicotinate-nucleotide diphosphorylase [Phycisphaerales bacterium]